MSTSDDAASAPKATTPKATAPKPAVAKAGNVRAPETPVGPEPRPKAKAAPMETTPPSAEAPPGTKRRGGLRRIAAITAVSALGVATVYLLAMTVLWGLHHRALTSAHADLTEKLTAQQAIVNSQGADLTAGHGKLDEALAGLSTYAKQKANAQDYSALFRANDAGMLDCANERVEVVREVKIRGSYITWTLHRYDDQVAAYCNEIVGAFDDNTASEESL